MSTYAIRFDYPETIEPVYAGWHKGALGWAPTLASAAFFDTADEAARTLKNGYGGTAIYGRVVAVKAGQPVHA